LLLDYFSITTVGVLFPYASFLSAENVIAETFFVPSRQCQKRQYVCCAAGLFISHNAIYLPIRVNNRNFGQSPFVFIFLFSNCQAYAVSVAI